MASINAAAAINVIDMISVALGIAAIGLQSTVGLGLAFVRTDPIGATRSMLAMFMVVPAFVLAVIWILPLERSVALALLALSISPMPPLLAITEKAIGGTDDYVFGMLLLAPLAALIAVPVFIGLAQGVFGRPVGHDLMAVMHIFVVTVGAPLLLGMLVNRFAPKVAAKLVRPFNQLSTGLLAIVTVAILFVAFPATLKVVGNGTVLVITTIAAFGLFAGHMAGGPHSGNRSALALICSQRHPGVAMAIAIAAFPDDAPATLGAMALYVIASVTIAVPYRRWTVRAQQGKA